MKITNWLDLLGGLALFLYGMQVLSDSLEDAAGDRLKTILEKLVNHYGFDTLGELIKIKCFNENPSIKSSLTFLRKTDWARKQVEDLYIKTLPKINKNNGN